MRERESSGRLKVACEEPRSRVVPLLKPEFRVCQSSLSESPSPFSVPVRKREEIDENYMAPEREREREGNQLGKQAGRPQTTISSSIATATTTTTATSSQAAHKTDKLSVLPKFLKGYSEEEQRERERDLPAVCVLLCCWILPAKTDREKAKRKKRKASQRKKERR